MWNDIPIYPTHALVKDYGSRYIRQHYKHFNADVCLSLFDIYNLEHEAFGQLPNWVVWAVIDGWPLHPLTARGLKGTKKVLAMSKFGKEVLTHAGFPSTYVPLAFDPEEYNTSLSKEDARDILSPLIKTELGERFVVGAVFANIIAMQDRKNVCAMFEVWAKFIKTHPDALLMIHSTTNSSTGGFNLLRLRDFFQIPEKNLIFSPQYMYDCGMLGIEYLMPFYSSCDFYLNTSKGEGFGVPLIEAQACGTPVIAAQNSACTELIKSGFGIPCTNVMDNAEVFWGHIDKGAAVKILSEAFEHRQDYDPESVRAQVSEFEADNVVTKLLAAIEV
jgi:glycosyltransferase involved in cell wall biosynthesis